MSVESDVSAMLATLQGRSPAAWAQQAAIMSDGVRNSGIIEQLGQNNSQLQSSLAGMAAVMGVSTRAIASEISRSNQFLQDVVDTLRDPAATAANERFRSGLNALNHGWQPEAIEEFRASIALFRFHALTHAALGHALAAEGMLTEAAASYALAQRYSEADSPGLAAGCALLRASALESAGEREEAIAVLVAANEALPDYPEIELAHARITGSEDSLRSALQKSPDLVVAALASGVAHVERVATEIASSGTGPVALARRMATSWNEIQEEFPEAGLETLALPEGSPAPGALLWAAEVIATYPAEIGRVRARSGPYRRQSDERAGFEAELASVVAETRRIAPQIAALENSHAPRRKVLDEGHVPQFLLANDDLYEYLPDRDVPGLYDVISKYEWRPQLHLSEQEVPLRDRNWKWRQTEQSYIDWVEKLDELGIADTEGYFLQYKATFLANLAVRVHEDERTLDQLTQELTASRSRADEIQVALAALEVAEQQAHEARQARWDELVSAAESAITVLPARRATWTS